MPEPVAPTTPIPVTLEAQEWNTVMAILAEQPFRVIGHIINKMTLQAQAGAAQAGGASRLTNGGDLEHPGGTA